MILLSRIFESIILEASREEFPTQKDIEKYLIKFYPKEKEVKIFNDNYGLFSKRPNDIVKKILLCTTATPEIVSKFKNEKYDLLISHHNDLVGIPQIIFHSIMDEDDKHGHNIYFAKRMGLQNIKKQEVLIDGKLYKPLTLDEFLKYLEKHGFKVEGVIYKNKRNILDNELISSVLYCSGLGGMLINDNVLENMDWNNHKEFDLRNVSKDVFVTGEIIDSKDLRNNKFKYVIELGHTSSEKPLFKWIKNEILNRWKNLQVDIANNSIDYFGKDKLFG